MTLRARSLIRTIHLCLGLSIGGLFALLGLTGSALVFYQEIDALLHPEIWVEAVGQSSAWDSPTWDQALATVRHRWPEEVGQWRFEATDTTGPIPARFLPSGPATGHMPIGKMVWLSPDGSKILRQDKWGEYAMTWIYNLHMELLSGDTGLKIVGWSGLVILVLLGTGMAAWWPKGSWRKAVAFKRNAVPIRRLHDLHKISGLWSMALLLILTGTGVMLALPKESNWLLTRTIAPIDPVPNPKSVRNVGPQTSIANALDVAHRALPQARLAWIEVPHSGDGAFKLRLQQPGDPSVRFPHSFVYVDQHNGSVLAVLDSAKAGPSTTINNWLHALHDASVAGLATRILGVVVGLTPTMLLITGIWHWLVRRRAMRARAQSPLSMKTDH